MTFELKDIMTITEVGKIHGIPKQTLHLRLKNLTEGVDYRKICIRMPILLSPDGVKKIINKYK